MHTTWWENHNRAIMSEWPDFTLCAETSTGNKLKLLIKLKHTLDDLVHPLCFSVYHLIFQITSVFIMAQAQWINFQFIRKERIPNSFLLKDTHSNECFCLACRSATYMEKFVKSSERELGFYQALLDFTRKEKMSPCFRQHPQANYT